MTVQFHNRDVLEYCREYNGEPYHALFCDPPYHLSSIVKRFGKGQKPFGTSPYGCYHSLTRGFMGQQWDGGDVAFQPETWAALSELLYPGAFLMAFAGTRGYHRMAIAMEDAGLILHPLMAWVFNSGFPKATRIDRQIDRDEGECVETGKAFNFKGAGPREDEFMANGRTSVRHIAKSERAQVWAGHRYGLQALKPAIECIAVAQKPYHGRPVENIAETGAGAFNIAAGTIGNDRVKTCAGNLFPAVYGDFNMCEEEYRDGRWPANLVIDSENAPLLGDAARFYFNSDWNAETAELLDNVVPFYSCPKADTGERDAGLNGSGIQRANIHPCVKPLALCRYLASLLLPPDAYAPRRILIPFSGSGSESVGAHLAGWEHVDGIETSKDYISIAEGRARYWSGKSGMFAESDEPDTQTIMEGLI